jgi:hypothetical protein
MQKLDISSIFVKYKELAYFRPLFGECLGPRANTTSVRGGLLPKYSPRFRAIASSAPTLFQQQVINALLVSRQPCAGFHTWAARAWSKLTWEHLFFSDNSMLVFTSRKPHATKHEPKNKNLETTCQVSTAA